jgi:hypothetical protein
MLATMGRLVQVAIVAAMATWVLYPLVWQVVFHLWPSACVAPDGSILLCLIDKSYTRPRDLTAVATSAALGPIAALILYFVTHRGSSRKSVRRSAAASN